MSWNSREAWTGLCYIVLTLKWPRVEDGIYRQSWRGVAHVAHAPATCAVLFLSFGGTWPLFVLCQLGGQMSFYQSDKKLGSMFDTLHHRKIFCKLCLEIHANQKGFRTIGLLDDVL